MQKIVEQEGESNNALRLAALQPVLMIPVTKSCQRFLVIAVNL